MSNDTTKTIRIGILSTAWINDVILDSVRRVQGVECTYIASRDLKRAQKYAEDNDIPNACTYDELLAAPIDAVYIPLPTAIAPDWAVRSAKAGKHVLVDKPFASVPEVERIKGACEEAKLVFMDGTHFAHAARTHEVRSRIVNGDIGKIKRVLAAFCYPIPKMAENIRSKPDVEPMTLWGDLGWYVSRAAVAFLGVEVASKIVSVNCSSKLFERFSNTVQSAEGIVEFQLNDGENVSLCFAVDGTASIIMRATIIGEEGFLELDDFVVPSRQTLIFDHIRDPKDFTVDLEYSYSKSVESIKGEDDYQWKFPTLQTVLVDEGGFPQAAKMIKEFARMIRENDLESSRRWMTETLVTQGIVDAVFEKIKEQHAF
ncbi:putative oxidoreductase [Gracilariopsis chorda]|uniref:Putative oxidoreductase n=1 Tax=Gracilariopsis chorda TaxID=448386 RepID=A0A2V3ITA2_9FLOR|nr:putative oxidoreductase [Gracilariopsis chorda]|eukprot:PXF45353.1 putative oxidoreductase [Gracilariopsis chorda]